MEAINENGDTILHLAVEEGKNYFVQKLLNFIKDEKQLEIKNSDGHTALHIAAIVGNQCAAELLVNKRKELLDIEDNETYLPLVCAYFKEQLDTFLYLWEATQKAYKLPPLDFNPQPAYLTGINMLNSALRMKQYELAEKLINLNPYLVTSDGFPMYTLTTNFPRQLDFVESLIYPSLKIVRQKLVKRLFLLFNSLGH